eukprot:14741422-Alexandrium_andersonii.AAC.1
MTDSQQEAAVEQVMLEVEAGEEELGAGSASPPPWSEGITPPRSDPPGEFDIGYDIDSDGNWRERSP